MKLLIITQVVDIEHPILGFFHRWIIEFAKHVEELHVIALQVGKYDLPENVHVHSLGKEDGVGKFEYVKRFYSYIWKYKNEYDSVFVHMNQVYVLLGAPIWALFGKRVGLWYVHRKVSFSLRFATMIVKDVFTTSPESFRIQTNKVHCLGHGIDMDQFKFIEREESSTLQVVTTGRVSKTKRIGDIVDAVSHLNKERKVSLTVVGGVATKEDVAYMATLKERAPSYVTFTGPLPHSDLPEVLSKHAVFVNLSSTESKDKAVLEALATGLPVVTTNGAFKDLLEKVGLYIGTLNTEVVAKKIIEAKNKDISNIVKEVRKENSIDGLISSIVSIYEKS